MKAVRYGLFAVLAISSVFLSVPAQADNLQQACSEMYAKLQTVKGASLARREGSFSIRNTYPTDYRTAEGVHYYGCIMILTGNKLEISGDWHPSMLFATDEHSDLYKQGWRLDPAGSGHSSDYRMWFKIVRGDVICLVSGGWGEFQGTTPNNMPSPLFEVDVSCGKETK